MNAPLQVVEIMFNVWSPDLAPDHDDSTWFDVELRHHKR